MKITKNQNLAECTSFGTGGVSEVFAVAESTSDLIEIIRTQPKPFWLLGFGANSLISDEGLTGTTIQMSLKNLVASKNLFVADAGVYWEDLVDAAIDGQLWGLEHMSGIPSSVGGAVVGNIAAYGQAVSDTLVWVEVIDHSKENPEPTKIMARDLKLEYRNSIFSTVAYENVILLRAAFQLSYAPITELKYASALALAGEEGHDISTLEGRRATILAARKRAGSLLNEENHQKTAGSFFKNPMVTEEVAKQIMAHEERPVSREQILSQNQIHGGDTKRVSAAHVLLAAGFERGQAWGAVRLHPDHVLKIENTGGATAQDIYNVAQEIISTVKEKLGIDLIPEVRFLGDFS